MSRPGLGLRFVVCAALLSAVAALAQLPATAPDGPVPPAILTAKKIFISNAGALVPIPSVSIFSGGPNRTYNQFYSGLKAVGNFELVGDPADADLILEPRIIGNEMQELSFNLVIYDRKTHFAIWALPSLISPLGMQKTRDRKFDDALNVLLQDFLKLTGKIPATAH